MNIESSLTSLAKTGRVSFGTLSTLRNIRGGSGKLVIISENCPPTIYDEIRQYSDITSIPVFVFKGSSNELGNVCMKPFPVSALTIFEAGDSDILTVLK